MSALNLNKHPAQIIQQHPVGECRAQNGPSTCTAAADDVLPRCCLDGRQIVASFSITYRKPVSEFAIAPAIHKDSYRYTVRMKRSPECQYTSRPLDTSFCSRHHAPPLIAPPSMRPPFTVVQHLSICTASSPVDCTADHRELHVLQHHERGALIVPRDAKRIVQVRREHPHRICLDSRQIEFGRCSHAQQVLSGVQTRLHRLQGGSRQLPAGGGGGMGEAELRWANWKGGKVEEVSGKW